MAFDWSVLHGILHRLPPGRWTTYGDLAEVIATAAQPLGLHIARCPECANAHRVLGSDGKVGPNFSWTDPDDQRDPQTMLEEEGLPVRNGAADPARRMSLTELDGLTRSAGA